MTQIVYRVRLSVGDIRLIDRAFAALAAQDKARDPALVEMDSKRMARIRAAIRAGAQPCEDAYSIALRRLPGTPDARRWTEGLTQEQIDLEYYKADRRRHLLHCQSITPEIEAKAREISGEYADVRSMYPLCGWEISVPAARKALGLPEPVIPYELRPIEGFCDERIY